MTRANSRTIRDVLNEYLLEASWWGFDKYAGTLNAHTKLDNKQIFNQALSEVQELIDIEKEKAIRSYVEPHIKYCEEQNGLSYCKNCQLTRPKENTNE